jgi:hypothetical protein
MPAKHPLQLRLLKQTAGQALDLIHQAICSGTSSEQSVDMLRYARGQLALDLGDYKVDYLLCNFKVKD